MEKLNWEKIRRKFAVTRKLAYFQSAGMSPIPRKVYQTIRDSYKKIYRYGDMFWPRDLEASRQLVHHISTFTGSRPEDLVFVPNTSAAFSMVALALRKTFPGEFNLVTMQDEFPASYVPFAYQGIGMKYVQSVGHRYPIGQIAAQIDEQTRGIVCSYVQYGTGYRHDLKALGKLAREKGLLFIVNATQGFPIFPIDVEKMNIDVFSASLHKWGCAGHVGALFYTSGAFRERFPAPMAGWLSVKPPQDDFIPTQKVDAYEPFADALQYNMGTINFQSLQGLKASFEFMQNTGWHNIRERILELSRQTFLQLSQIPGVEIITPQDHPGERSGILSINLPGKNNSHCVEFLQSKGVVTTIRQHNIRIACNYFNNAEDINRLISGLQDFLAPDQTGMQ